MWTIRRQRQTPYLLIEPWNLVEWPQELASPLTVGTGLECDVWGSLEDLAVAPGLRHRFSVVICGRLDPGLHTRAALWLNLSFLCAEGGCGYTRAQSGGAMLHLQQCAMQFGWSCRPLRDLPALGDGGVERHVGALLRDNAWWCQLRRTPLTPYTTPAPRDEDHIQELLNRML